MIKNYFEYTKFQKSWNCNSFLNEIIIVVIKFSETFVLWETQSIKK